MVFEIPLTQALPGRVSDPLPASPALPLCQGESGFTVPLRQGDKHERSECRGSLTRTLDAKS